MTTFSYTSGNPSNLIGGTGASMADIQGPFTDIRTFVNGSITDTNLASNAAIAETKLASGGSGAAKGAFSAYRSADVTLTTGSVVVFDAEEFDVSGWFDTATGRFTPQVPGHYRLSSQITSRDVQATDVAWVPVLRKNAANLKNGMNGYQRGASTPVNGAGSWGVVANGTTDFFDVIISHTAGATTFVKGTAATTYFQGELIGRS